MNYNKIAGQKTSRIEALSDGVFAIAMTLLVLDLKIPTTELIHSDHDIFTYFLQNKFKFTSYFLGFITLGLFWLAQNTQLHFIKNSDKIYSWYNILFLSLISLLPFTTAFLSEFYLLKSSFLMYWINLLLPGIVLVLSFNYAQNNKLISDEYLPEFKSIKKAYFDRIKYAQFFYFIGIILCFIDYRLSLGFIFLVQLNFAIGLSKK
jgi:uncharacterized membrane protein